MATNTDAPAVTGPDPAGPQGRTLTVGLFWGAAALALLTWWLYLKHWEDAAAVVVSAGVLTLLTLGLALWQARAARPARRPAGFALLGLSAALLLLAVWLAGQRGLGLTFPEVSSAFVLAVIGAAAGLWQLAEPAAPWGQEQVLQWLLARRQPLMAVLLVLGAALLVTGVVVAFRQGLREAFPEAAGAVLLGLLFGSAGVWLLSTLSVPVPATNMRVLVLTVGGVAGLIIAVMTVIRAVLWWDTAFAGGIRAWQGPEAWRLWLCFYVELLGLAVLFASLLLGYADIRINAVLRRLLFGYNSVLTGLLLLGILVVVNVTVYAYYPYTFQWTKARGLYSLSDKSKNTLEKLAEPVTIYVLLSPGRENFGDVRTLLENVRAFTNRVSVEYISPDVQVDRFRELRDRFPKLGQGGRGLLIVYGPATGKTTPPNAFIPAASLWDQKPLGQEEEARDTKWVREFKGEDLLMTELRTLAKGGQQPVIYFTQGRGELDINDSDRGDPHGAGLFREWLKSKRYEVHALVWGPPPKGKPADSLTAYSQKTLDEPHAIPKDAKTVIIAQPQMRFEPEILAALDKYLQDKGRLMVLSNIKVEPNAFNLVRTGLEDFLKKYGVELTGEFVMNAGQQLPPLINFAAPPARGDNPIAVSFRDKADFPVQGAARVVRPEPGQGTNRAETVLEVASPPNVPVFWGESDLKALQDPTRFARSLSPQQLMEKQSTAPLPVGVAVTGKDNPALVVYGDALMASNYDRFPQVPYFDLMASSLEWLAGRPENIGIEPRKDTFYRFRSPTISVGRMVLLPAVLILLTIVGIGAGVWVVRRR
jgi:hypothetical protein